MPTCSYDHRDTCLITLTCASDKRFGLVDMLVEAGGLQGIVTVSKAGEA